MIRGEIAQGKIKAKYPTRINPSGIDFLNIVSKRPTITAINPNKKTSGLPEAKILPKVLFGP